MFRTHLPFSDISISSKWTLIHLCLIREDAVVSMYLDKMRTNSLVLYIAVIVVEVR